MGRLLRLDDVTSKRAALVVALAWSAIVIYICGKVLVRPTAHSVFPLYYQIADLWWTGTQPTTLDANACARHHGPIFGTLLAPLAALPIRVAGSLWFLGSMAVFLSANWALVRRWPTPLTSLALPAYFLLLPWVGGGSLTNLQTNVLFAGLLIWGTLAVIDERWWLASALLLIPTCAKLYPVALPLVFVGLYPRTFGPRFAATLVGFVCLPYLFSSWQFVNHAYTDWYEFVATGERYARGGWYNHDVRTLLETYGLPLTVKQFIPIQFLTGVCVFGLTLWYRKRGASATNLVLKAYQLCAVWMILFGPASEHQTYLLASPALSMMIIDAWSRGASRLRKGTLAAGFLMAGPFTMDILGRQFRLWATSMKFAPLGLLIAGSWLVYDMVAGPVEATTDQQGSKPDSLGQSIDKAAA